MTEAKVVITAQNRVGAGVRSATADLNNLGREGQRVGKLIQSAFALSGVFGFGRAIAASVEATKKFDGTFARKLDDVHASFENLLAVKGGLPEINKQLDELTGILQDPGVRAGADQFFGALISGAASAAKGLASLFGMIRLITVQTGLADPKTQQEKIEALDAQISTEQASMAIAKARRGSTAPYEARIKQLLAEQQKAIDAGPTAFDKPADIDPFRSSEFAKNNKAPFSKSVNPQVLLELNQGGDYLDAQQKIQDATDALEEFDLNAIEAKKDIEKTFKSTSIYAEEAARNMQDAFAQFLFDPFKDGIKGMLKAFLDVTRQILAQKASASIFESKFATGLLNSLFGSSKGLTGGGGSFGGSGITGSFAQGGSFNVGGSGGVDSQLVAFKATPGESVKVGQGSGLVFAPVYNIHASGGASEAVVELAAQRASDDAVSRVMEIRRRGGLG